MTSADQPVEPAQPAEVFAPSQHVTVTFAADNFSAEGDGTDPETIATQWVMAPWGGGPVSVKIADADIHSYEGPYQSLRTIGQYFYGYNSGVDDERFDRAVTS